MQMEFNKTVRNITKNIDNVDEKNLVLSKLNGKLPSISYFYGAPKIHKPGCPLRPIIATCGSPSSHMAKWLADCLSPYLGTFSDSNLKHSSDFVDEIRKLGPVNGRMMSLDVTALFTNVPLVAVLNFLHTDSH